MIIQNRKFATLLGCIGDQTPDFYLDLAVVVLDSGFFFSRVVNPNVKRVVHHYRGRPDFDWPGYEYTANKVHLEDEVNAPILMVLSYGLHWMREAVGKFKNLYPGVPASFSLSCDEFSEYPSVVLSFYVKRPGMLPLLPENESELEFIDIPMLIDQI